MEESKRIDTKTSGRLSAKLLSDLTRCIERKLGEAIQLLSGRGYFCKNLCKISFIVRDGV